MGLRFWMMRIITVSTDKVSKKWDSVGSDADHCES